jgi:hypothetical protein
MLHQFLNKLKRQHAGLLLGLLFNPKDEAICSSEMLIDFYWIT